MKRRHFLQRAGLLCASGTTIAAGATIASGTTKAATAAQSDQAKEDGQIKSVLVTSAQTPLAKAIAAALGDAYRVHLTGPREMVTDLPYTRSDLGHDESTDRLVSGMDAVVHVAQPPPGASERERIDRRTRGTYNLLRAAATQGVRRVVYLSSLAMMTGYDEDFEVSEDWRPPLTDSPHVLSDCLGEFTCREFARSGQLGVVVLRLGTVVKADEVKGKPFDPLWVEERDAASAVRGALSAQFSDNASSVGFWKIFHIQSGSPRARFTSARAQSSLGYQPQFNW